MSPVADFTGKFRINTGASRVVKRPRPTLICTACRRQKLKCDKNQPCGSCVKRKEGDKCVYTGYDASQNPGSSLQGVAEERLGHLEQMVMQLMQQQGTPGVPQTAETTGDNINTGADRELLPKYVGSTHWSVMLEDIQELKAVMSLSGTESTEAGLTTSTEVIYGAAAYADSLDQVIRQFLPLRSVVDQLLATYFSGETFIVPVVHTVQFLRQLERYWTVPQHTNPLWLSMLFSLCYMASRISPADGWFIPIEFLHTAAGQCLVLGQYQEAQRYVVEALMLYAQSKNFDSLDPSRECGAILNMVVRHAHMMGYHRDPDILGGFSVFEGEMRRRVWAACKQMDLMLSFQLGLPSLIRLDNCDTESLSNLLDSDFDENATILPKPRPEDEPTQLLWFVIKDKQMATFGKICQDSLSFKEASQAEILQLDVEVEAMYASVPPVLRPRELTGPLASPFVWMTGVYIEFIYLKSLCVLHRRNMTRGFQYSISSADSAARRLVQRFLSAYQEARPGGLLENHQWMVNCFSMNDFLLGVTTLCLSTHVQAGQGYPYTGSRDGTGETAYDLLRKSLAVCEEKSDVSRDAAKVAKAVRVLLKSDTQVRQWPVDPDNALKSKCAQNDATENSNPPIESLDWYAGIERMDFTQYDPFDFLNNPTMSDELDMSELNSSITDGA